MAIDQVGIYAAVPSFITTGGEAVTIAYGPLLGGIIVNPATAVDQGLDAVEVLYVNIITTAGTVETATTTPLQPGQSYTIPNITTNVSVNAATSGHHFTAILFQPHSAPIPGELIGLVNPCLQNVIPSYLYQQYANDDDLQAFVAAYNEIAQEYVTWLNAVSLPVYTGPLIIGDLLDWVALGLYGVARPVLSSPRILVGPFNTYLINSLAFNARRSIDPHVVDPVDDDIFKRVLTWKLYKGDGKTFSIRWLKRRVMRFLIGANGTDPNTADTSQISVTFGGNPVSITLVEDGTEPSPAGSFYNGFAFNTAGYNTASEVDRPIKVLNTYTHDNQININLISQRVTSIGGAFFNTFMGNALAFNAFTPLTVEHFSPLPNQEIFKEAIEEGVLDMPFQFKTVVNIR